MNLLDIAQGVIDDQRAKDQRLSRIESKLDSVINQVESLSVRLSANTRGLNNMANILDAELAENTEKIAAQTTVVNGLTVFLEDLVAKQKAALEAAIAAGATQQQLATLTANNDALAATTDRIVAAMKIGTAAENEPDAPVVAVPSAEEGEAEADS